MAVVTLVRPRPRTKGTKGAEAEAEDEPQLHFLPKFALEGQTGLEGEEGDTPQPKCVAFALPHGSILFEDGRATRHATTKVDRPDWRHPKRVGVVFTCGQAQSHFSEDHDYSFYQRTKRK